MSPVFFLKLAALQHWCQSRLNLFSGLRFIKCLFAPWAKSCRYKNKKYKIIVSSRSLLPAGRNISKTGLQKIRQCIIIKAQVLCLRSRGVMDLEILWKVISKPSFLSLHPAPSCDWLAYCFRFRTQSLLCCLSLCFDIPVSCIMKVKLLNHLCACHLN